MNKLILLVGILLSQVLLGQNSKYLSFELAGSGGIASFNYECSFHSRKSNTLYYRLGFSLAPIDRNNGTTLIFPLMVHTNIGKSAHKLDLGIGQTVSITTKGHIFFLMPLSMGYRFQPENKRHY